MKIVNYPCKFPKGKLFHHHLDQKKHNAAEEQSCCSACGQEFHVGGLHPELSMPLAGLNESN